MINRKGLSSLDNKSNQNKDNQKVKTNPITVGRVTDIILNEEFPNIKQYGGSKRKEERSEGKECISRNVKKK